MLTSRQADALIYIDGAIRAKGYSPSYAEIGVALGVTRCSVHRLVWALDRRGFIRLLPGKRRSIEVVRSPLRSTGDPEADCPASLHGALRDAWIEGYRVGRAHA